ncbi:hypothetical protein RIR_jg22380.t1 [Rhizophagus irregularis DAOM 181602=DAOM 197198]|nr:hypothetical protein RIR_jg22380.t1 [Rhizophagus irregularis DAOM 181602=DAOM 197198]
MPIWYPVPSALVGFLDVGHHFFFEDASLNTKLDFKDAGLDTNRTLRAPAWTIRREIQRFSDFLGVTGILVSGSNFGRQVNFSFIIESQKPKK